MSRVYALNKSKSKFIVGGLWQRDADTWLPRIVLSGQYWQGACLTAQEWRTFLKFHKPLTTFLNGGCCEPEMRISHNCVVLAKEVYNKRAVVVEITDGKLFGTRLHLENALCPTDLSTLFLTDYGQPTAVTMHQVTFDGLMRAATCITDWIEFLEYHDAALNHCWGHVKKLKFDARAGDPLTIVKDYMGSFSEFLRNDAVFVNACNDMMLYDADLMSTVSSAKTSYPMYNRKN